jgi:hypothetical protein
LPALLATVNVPVAAPVAVGAKCTMTVDDCPGLSVTGKLPPVTVNPAPAAVTELIVSAAVPEEVNVTDCGVALVFTVTSPKESAFVLRASCGVSPVNCRLKVFVTVPAVAVRVAVSVVLTAFTVAVKLALVVFAAMATDDGTVTELLLLDRFTTCPPLPAAAFSDTVQASVPAPV